MRRGNWILLAAALVLMALPLWLPLNEDREQPFSGADSQARTAITAAHPDYRPWFEPLWKPPSSEIENLLWALQAGLGGGLLGYYLGYRRGRSRRRQGSDAAD